MLAFMPVIPYRTNLFQDCKNLRQFLLAFKQAAIQKKQAIIVSISQEIKPIDPLAVIQKIAKPNQLHFYFEKAGTGEAIAAIDTVVSLKLKGRSRFYQSQQFIDSCFANIIITGTSNLPFAGPHFFCSFTFYDDLLKDDSPFPYGTIFLPRLQVSCRANKGYLISNIVISPQANVEVITEQLCHQFQEIISSEYSSAKNTNSTQEIIIDKNIKDKKKFYDAVVSSLESIRVKQLHKIVLAQAVDVISSAPFNLVHSLQNLRISNPDCYIFSTSNGKGQNFIGASPERLISIQNHELVTDALAGSAPRGKTAAEDAELANRLLSSEKERREHRVVLDFITQRLTGLGLTPQMASVPQLLQLSNIQHLWTPIQAKVPEKVHPLEILAELHPTPAVAGLPRDIVYQQIRRYEAFDRSLYAAPLGWIDHRGNSEFVVGIRSALIDGDRARLYAGAGIVAGSDPDKELAEIQLKLQALLEALV
ncbi:MAG: isochorismate synthase [Aphanothece sp. CMT-3BRIN-NPC111]|nr:isochorismate synthase [Aphanothece sp. CMT-3BRIN-NPC111]